MSVLARMCAKHLWGVHAGAGGGLSSRPGWAQATDQQWAADRELTTSVLEHMKLYIQFPFKPFSYFVYLHALTCMLVMLELILSEADILMQLKSQCLPV